MEKEKISKVESKFENIFMIDALFDSSKITATFTTVAPKVPIPE